MYPESDLSHTQKKLIGDRLTLKRCRVSVAVSKIGHGPRSTGTIHTMTARMENLKMGLKECLHIGSGNVCGLCLKGVTNEIDKVSMIHHFQRTLDSVVAVFCTGSRCLNLLFMFCNSCGYITESRCGLHKFSQQINHIASFHQCRHLCA